jgi:hypothetical protein
MAVCRESKKAHPARAGRAFSIDEPTFGSNSERAVEQALVIFRFVGLGRLRDRQRYTEQGDHNRRNAKQDCLSGKAHDQVPQWNQACNQIPRELLSTPWLSSDCAAADGCPSISDKPSKAAAIAATPSTMACLERRMIMSPKFQRRDPSLPAGYHRNLVVNPGQAPFDV